MKFVLDFLQQIISLLQIKFESKPDEEIASADDAIDAYKWLMEQMKISNNKRVALHKDPKMHTGKIYIFQYIPKYKDVLDYWDMHPIMLFLGYTQGAEGLLAVGLNISWYPPEARKWIVEKIRHMYKEKYESAIKKKPKDAIAQLPVLLDLYILKQNLDMYGFSFALRTYIPANMRNPKVCLSYEDWDKAIRLDQPRIFPQLKINGNITLANIYKSFKFYIRDLKARKAEWKRNLDENKKLMKYKFIK